MRLRGKTDANQAAIVKALRDCGMSVKDLSMVGGGFPDLCVGWRGKHFLIETKTKRDGHNKPEPLTQMQREFHVRWAGDIGVVTTGEEAIQWVLESAGLCRRSKIMKRIAAIAILMATALSK